MNKNIRIYERKKKTIIFLVEIININQKLRLPNFNRSYISHDVNGISYLVIGGRKISWTKKLDPYIHPLKYLFQRGLVMN